LESVRQSQVILHVCDVSNPAVREQIAAVEEVLREMDVLSLERLMVFNKIDLTPGQTFEALRHAYPGAIFLSARTGEGLDELKERMAAILARDVEEVELAIPPGEPLLREILAIGRPRDQHWEPSVVRVRVALPRRFLPVVERFRVASPR
jgi:GTP-binding protein HflX